VVQNTGGGQFYEIDGQSCLRHVSSYVKVDRFPELILRQRIADLSFSKDARMQDGTGDGSYMDFIHKYMSVLGVSLS
jgi:hypothetical protein